MRPIVGWLLLTLTSFQEILAEHDSIPEHLYECYEQRVTLHPMSVTSLINIIRKVETSQFFYMDARMLTNSIINRFWRDGIERDPNIINRNPSVIAYKTSGFQSHKYKLLYSYLIPNSGFLFPNDTLTLEERCTLHFMLSRSVDVWERGDEDDTCPDLKSFQKQWDIHEWSGVKKSTCPIENGVILTNGFGTVSPSQVLGAIATSLQPLEVNQEFLIPKSKRKKLRNQRYETVNNIWASTLSGDLAEVIVFQKPLSEEIFIGPPGMWNSSEIPVHSYLRAGFNTILHELWQFTDAEVLGAVDGLILADQVLSYSNMTYSLRLSQVLEMYYTNRGGDYPNQYMSCTRKNYFFETLLQKEKTIYEQTLRFAEVLAFYAPRYFTDNVFLEQHIDEGFNKFKNYASNLITLLSKPCPDQEETKSKINLFVLFDSTWSSYETIEVLTHISDQIDVSHFGSNITVINGVTGDLIAYSATTTGDLYQSWMQIPQDRKNTDSMNIHRGFLRLKNLLETESMPENEPFSLITLVIAPSTSVSDNSFEDITSILKSIKPNFPDMKFVYVTSTVNSRAYAKLTSLPGSQTDQIITFDEKHKPNLYKNLQILQDAPSSLVPPKCTREANGFVNFTIEEYITLGVKQTYRIHPMFLCSGKNIGIKIVNYNYGSIEVCLKRDQNVQTKNATCFLSSGTEELYFPVDAQCSSIQSPSDKQGWDPGCRPVYIEVIARRSFRKCAEKDCRFPNDIRYTIHTAGLKCRSYPITCNSSIKSGPISLYILLLLSYKIFQ